MPSTLEPKLPELIDAVSQFPEDQFERFLCLVAARRRHPKSLGKRESELLLKLSDGPPAGTWEEFQRLRSKKERGELGADDEVKIAEVIDVLENYAAQRVRWLGELAGLRNQSVKELMKSLELELRRG